MANEKLGVATEPSPESLPWGGFRFVQWGLTFRNLNKLFHISIWGGLELCFGGAKPTKAPRGDGTVWQNFSLVFNAIDSKKYLGYEICQACKICQTLFISMTGPKVAQRIQVVSILLHEAKPVVGLFCFIRTQLVEVIMW